MSHYHQRLHSGRGWMLEVCTECGVAVYDTKIHDRFHETLVVVPPHVPGHPELPDSLGVACGKCGGQVYMETCRMSRPTDHDWTIASECQQCGARHEMACVDCAIDGGR